MYPCVSFHWMPLQNNSDIRQMNFLDEELNIQKQNYLQSLYKLFILQVGPKWFVYMIILYILMISYLIAGYIEANVHHNI